MKATKLILRSGIVFLCCVSVLTGCGSSNDKTPSTSTVTPEKEAYTAHCANCHGGSLEGGFGPALKHVGKNLTKEDILKVIKKGRGNMPAQVYVEEVTQQQLATWLSNQK